jgi:endonuclease/exonuclease/phosphatase family metal-dependent hydrolase
MKLIAICLLFICCSGFTNAAPLDVMTYNIRCGSCEPADSPNNWKKRKYLVAHLIKAHNPDIIGLQEAEINQLEDLVEMLDDYSWIGVGREDGKEKGETTGILFRHARFSLQGQQTLWLSQTPQQVSRGWDAHFRRTLTIAKLMDTATKQQMLVFNTHFDNEGELARQESAKFLLAEITRQDPLAHVVVTGDFNFKSDSKSYEIITQALADAEKLSSTPAVGGNKTYNAFGEDKEANNKIDFVFVKKDAKVLSHKVDTTLYNNLFPSDHYPVIVRLDLSVPAQQ